MKVEVLQFPQGGKMPLFVFKSGKIVKGLSGAQYDGEKIPGDLLGWNELSTDSNYKYFNTYGILSARSGTLYPDWRE